jgi:predicted ester cyclase
MSAEENEAIVRRWFIEFWGNPFNPDVIDELAAPDIRFEYWRHEPLRGRDQVRQFANNFRDSFPDLSFWADLEILAEGDYVVGQWEGGDTHTGALFGDLPIGSGPAGSADTMRVTGTSMFKVQNGLIVAEVGLDDSVRALQHLGIIPTA